MEEQFFDVYVTCDVCKDVFTSDEQFGCYNQARRCASEVHGDYIYGFFGSELIDMQIWRFVTSRPSSITDKSVICDNCIKYFIDNNIIKKNKEY